MNRKSMIDFMYGSALGRAVISALLRVKLAKAMAWYLHTSLSRPMIRKYIKKHSINMDEFEPEKYSCFADFFIRKRMDISTDTDRQHLISPCDSLMSVFPIDEDSSFTIKHSRYRIDDLLHDTALAKKFVGGTCLIFRLQAQDYHRYCYIDDCYVGENRFFEGKLHSVQPIACEHYPLYRLNRRMCTVLRTDNFGTVAQIEVGALAVGGIVNLHENCRVTKGEEMGRFELCGSTIVTLFEKGRVELPRELLDAMSGGKEIPVSYGKCIGVACTAPV